ncbi:MAG: prepilin-type N-terminal cleavage/methylation domain-containing protein [Desulfamplus sp.]|nr:prepilin-type N-terminal cleavage/methylation domain-containing protein [Desulfamplus sp.]
MKYSSKHSWPNRNGFTLIEIIVVIILIAIAGSLVLMNVGQSGRMKESRMFADKIVAMCKKARLSAVGKGIPSCLTISSESRECSIGFMDDAMSDSQTAINDGFEGSSRNIDKYGDFPSSSENADMLKIPENILLEGENIKVDSNGLYFICFYPDGSSGGGILAVSVENEFEFTFQVDMLTGSIKEISSHDSF